MSSTLMSLKAQSDANSAEKQRLVNKKKSILLLMHDYLVTNGYMDTAAKLSSECSSAIGKHEIADNIDLDVILSEYEAYYEMRFNKKPKLLRKLKDDEINPRLLNHNDNNISGKKNIAKKSDGSSSGANSSSHDKLPHIPGAQGGNLSLNHSQGPEADDSNTFLGVQGTGFTGKGKNKQEAVDTMENRVLKPPPQFGGDSELKQLAVSISREIYQDSPDVRFDDIIGLEEGKRLLREAVQLPLRFPSIFTGILRPWRGILLHGPPGTGKTLLAKAVATECSTTFFNISASTLVSKWRGDSEKLVRVLFDMARYHSPSTIFLDEIDSILTSRGSEGNEHEASRRMKTELLIQMDGVKGNTQNNNKTIEQVFVMAASNLPWDLDIAVLRRLEKRVLVGLPVLEARKAMLQQHLGDRSSDIQFDEIAARTEGFSGADIELLCREAAMMPVRRLMMKINDLDTQVLSRKGSVSNNPVDVDTLIKSDPVCMSDINAALLTTRPSSDGTMTKYELWQNEYGSS